MQIQNLFILCLYHSTIFRPRSKGDHPRHSPRTFPLGLLAPRCLGFLLILRIPAPRVRLVSSRIVLEKSSDFVQETQLCEEVIVFRKMRSVAKRRSAFWRKRRFYFLAGPLGRS